MLVDPKIEYDIELMKILSFIGQREEAIKQETGIFLSKSFCFDNSIKNEKNDYFSFTNDLEYLSPYGVCDTIEQVKEKYKNWLNDTVLKFCISFTKVIKSEQPSIGGWRWHKWGKYIGNKNPEFEYLYDENDDIQEVYCYHIYQLLT